MGVTYSEFRHLTPNKLEYIAIGYRMKKEERDEEMWQQGRYFHRAILSAMDISFNGKDAVVDYFDKPITYLVKEELDKSDEDRILEMLSNDPNFIKAHKKKKENGSRL